jgi:site-specific DNA-methyltransferase (adenine-specific)
VETNVLYYGDNLDILRRYVPGGSVDLVYLDPPFNSNADYNVIFRDESGRKSDAQLLAFEDTWHWGPSVASTYAYLTNTSLHHGKVPEAVSAIVGALRSGLGTNQMTAYIVEMTVRLVELHRVLRPTGSLWLHCDPTASHYLKLVLDAVFGPRRFLNEVVWQRTGAHNDARRFGRVTDTLLYYAKGETYTFNAQYTEYDPEYVAERYRYDDGDGRKYWANTMTAPSHGRPVEARAFRGELREPPPGTMWRFTQAETDRMEREGRIYYSKSGMPYVKSYLDERKGRPAQNLWTDIVMSKSGAERLGYPTQKPVALLERIIEASSNLGDVELDPFCGCGTALVAAQKLGRRWVGIDITHLSVAVMRARLRDSFPELGDVKVIGQPTEVEGARMLAAQSLDGRYEFQYWALSLVDAQPSGGRKKGADSGIDGRITFTDAGGEVRPVLVSVKSGHVNVAQVRDLIGAMDAEKAPLGLFLTLEPPSRPMVEAAAAAGVFYSELAKREYPRVQLFTIEELLAGKRPVLPLLVLPTYQQAERVEKKAAEQQELFG